MLGLRDTRPRGLRPHYGGGAIEWSGSPRPMWKVVGPLVSLTQCRFGEVALDLVQALFEVL